MRIVLGQGRTVTGVLHEPANTAPEEKVGRAEAALLSGFRVFILSPRNCGTAVGVGGDNARSSSFPELTTALY
ncbi:hypothetical protein Cadr_000000987 [Camelus dromedarius]|uniref:Uncharacterized protein n=1 Tax=Camelus dromedarius TaxID=9838 RepID=A0A5N4EK74_CAMDR|nr:hypothetical protein Cadr_000000987 [Camelus dromedarius]